MATTIITSTSVKPRHAAAVRSKHLETTAMRRHPSRAFRAPCIDDLLRMSLQGVRLNGRLAMAGGRSSVGDEAARFSPVLFQHAHAGDGHAAVHRLDHVV